MNWTRYISLLLRGVNKALWVNDALKAGALVISSSWTRRRRDGRGMMSLDPNQQGAIGAVVDLCADIREIYSCLALRGKKEKLSEIEELAQEEDSQAMVSLENDLDCYYDTCLALDMPEEIILEAVGQVLPHERFDQLLQRRRVAA